MPTKHRFTPEQLTIIHNILRYTWDYIGPDYLQATAEAGEGSTVPRATVIESVLDANYADQFVKTPEQRAAWEPFSKLPYEEMKKIAKGAFTYKRYGM